MFQIVQLLPALQFPRSSDGGLDPDAAVVWEVEGAAGQHRETSAGGPWQPCETEGCCGDPEGNSRTGGLWGRTCTGASSRGRSSPGTPRSGPLRGSQDMISARRLPPPPRSPPPGGTEASRGGCPRTGPVSLDAEDGEGGEHTRLTDAGPLPVVAALCSPLPVADQREGRKLSSGRASGPGWSWRRMSRSEWSSHPCA